MVAICTSRYNNQQLCILYIWVQILGVNRDYFLEQS
jgi:hypothetical protein